MLRKSLILGSITLLMVMLFAFTGCEGPVGPAGPAGGDGKPGENGKPGVADSGSIGSAVVTESELAAAFDRGKEVVLYSSVKFVSGEVPAGKTLYVLGTDTKVSPGAVLAVNGTLDVSGENNTAILTASGISGFAGTLKAGGGASITGTGIFILPYVVSGPYDGGLEYGNPLFGSVVSYPGSTVVKGGEPAAFNSSGIRTILEGGAESLTVWNVEDLESFAIPEGKSLVLEGEGNKIINAFILKGGASLTIDSDAVLTATASLTTSDDNTLITNNGTIVLDGNNVSAAKGAGGDFINNGIITSNTASSSDSPSVIRGLLALKGSGTVRLIPELSAKVDIVLGNGLVLLNQKLVIAPTLASPASPYLYSLSFPNEDSIFDEKSEEGETIEIANSYGLISLGANTEAIGVKVINNGTVETATISDEFLVAIFDDIDNKGRVLASGVFTTISKAFEVPEGIVLVLNNSGTTLGGGEFPITVNGTLEILKGDSGGLAPRGDFTVNGTLKIWDEQVFKPVSNVIITSGGSLDLGYGTHGGRIVIAAGKALKISSTSVLAETLNTTTGLLVPVIGQIVLGSNPFTIDDIDGYGATGDIVGGSFAAALKAVHDSAAILNGFEFITLSTPSLFLGVTNSPVDVVGTLEFFSGALESPIYRNNLAQPDLLTVIPFPTGVAVYKGAGNTGAAMVPPVGINAGSEYEVLLKGYNTKNVLTVSDKGTFGATDLFGVVSFDAVRFECLNLVGPSRPAASTAAPTPEDKWVNPFRVGIKTKRTTT